MKIKVNKIMAVGTGIMGVSAANFIAKASKEVKCKTKEEEIAKNIGVAALEVGIAVPTVCLAAELWNHGPEITVKPGKKVKKAAKKVIKGVGKLANEIDELLDEVNDELMKEEAERMAAEEAEEERELDELANQDTERPLTVDGMLGFLQDQVDQCDNSVDISELGEAHQNDDDMNIPPRNADSMNTEAEETPVAVAAEKVNEEPTDQGTGGRRAKKGSTKLEDK